MRWKQRLFETWMWHQKRNNVHGLSTALPKWLWIVVFCNPSWSQLLSLYQNRRGRAMERTKTKQHNENQPYLFPTVEKETTCFDQFKENISFVLCYVFYIHREHWRFHGIISIKVSLFTATLKYTNISIKTFQLMTLNERYSWQMLK